MKKTKKSHIVETKKHGTSDIARYARIYKESCRREMQLNESASDDEILSNVFSALLAFMSGDGDKILRDGEWMNYLVNDIQQAVQSGLFKPDRESQEKLQQLFMGEDL